MNSNEWHLIEGRHPWDGRPMFLDRCGNPITLGRHMDLIQDHSYCVLHKTIVGDVEVSTVWLGIDPGFMGPPLTYETMVFPLDDSLPVWEFQARYSTETQAHEGHWATVREVRKPFLPAVVG